MKIEQITEPYDIAIVLGGFSSSNAYPRDRIHFQKGADRLTNALELYFQGKVKKIMLSGSSSNIIGERVSESERVKTTLKKLGFPMENLITEERSRNTRENAEFSKKTIEDLFEADPKVLLVTSSFHMPRALGCFKKEGLEVTPFATDLYSFDFSWSPNSWLIPNSGALVKWNILLKEWMGIFAYKIAGYI